MDDTEAKILRSILKEATAGVEKASDLQPEKAVIVFLGSDKALHYTCVGDVNQAELLGFAAFLSNAQNRKDLAILTSTTLAVLNGIKAMLTGVEKILTVGVPQRSLVGP